MSIRMGRKISEGACAEIYEWEGNEKIIKLAKTNTDYHSMKKEYLNSQVAWDNGLSIPKPFELIEIDGRWGIVFERIYGETLMERFMKQFLISSSVEYNKKEIDYEYTTRITAKVLSEIHSKSIASMPSQRNAIIYSIKSVNYLTNSEKELVIDILNNIPIKQQLCHGDPNPNNVLIRNDKALVIDWMNASIGNPEADLAEYIIMIRFGILPPQTPSELVCYLNSIREEIIKVFLDEYMKLSNSTPEEIYPWILIIAARKLSADGIIEEEKKLLVDEIRRRLKNINS